MVALVSWLDCRREASPCHSRGDHIVWSFILNRFSMFQAINETERSEIKSGCGDILIRPVSVVSRRNIEAESKEPSFMSEQFG